MTTETEREEALRLAKEAGFYWPAISTTTIEERLVAFFRLARATKPAAPDRTALERYKEFTADDPIHDPVEALRFFCALSMRGANGQDWLDVESFFDAVIAAMSTKPAAPDIGKAPARLDWLIDQLDARLGVLDKLSSRLPELDLLVELDKRLKPAAPAVSAEPVASSKCPICGVDIPHGHTEAETQAYHDDQVRGDGWTSSAINPKEAGLYIIRGHKFPDDDKFHWLRNAYAYPEPREEIAMYKGNGWWHLLYNNNHRQAYVHPSHWCAIPNSRTVTATQLSAHGAEQFLAGQRVAFEKAAQTVDAFIYRDAADKIRRLKEQLK